MIRRQRPDEAAFRHGPKGREPLAAPNQGGSHVHYQPLKRAGLGCITSRDGKAMPAVTFFEVLAFELGCNVATAKRLFEEGLI